MDVQLDPQDIKKTLKTKTSRYTIFSFARLAKLDMGDPCGLPFSIKILLESALRNYDGYQITHHDIQTLLNWSPGTEPPRQGGANLPEKISFKPGRVILQDFTGVPCVVDLAAMRSAVKRLGGDIKKINPQVPCDLVIDHSVQVDAFGTKSALGKNTALEFKRNRERYEFLKWGQKAFQNFRVIPPAMGIVHQVNLEYLAQGILKRKAGREILVYPDSLVGTDSHTTMINGLGIIGWGVGGIEAEAVMLGEPIDMLSPEVVGCRLKGQLKEGVTATDLVLTVTRMLRQKGVVGKFVEFYGDGLGSLSLPDRATIANMAPEYGATIGLFPIDEETLRYYRLTGRSPTQVDLIERYMKEQGMFYDSRVHQPQFSETVELDLCEVQPSLAGPKRPQDRVAMSEMKETFRQSLESPVEKMGFGLDEQSRERSVELSNRAKDKITHGTVVIAAITSCTNTSNPSVLIAAGILAKKAVERGLKIKDYVKTSLAPGSRVVEEYLRAAGLLEYLEKLKFHIVGYGCTTCIGNSGPLPQDVAEAVQKGQLVAASVLSGNRNFEGRINPQVKANYLASPPLVVAYALAGRVDINLDKEPIGRDKQGGDVYLKDIWPSNKEIRQFIDRFVTAKAFRKCYKDISKGNTAWNAIKSTKSDLYLWKEQSTYIQEPPFFIGMKKEVNPIHGIKEARVLVMLGDSITTDHISPAGAFSPEAPAGQYLIKQGVKPQDFNSYGSRRGNDRVMTRGTFANVRLRNQLLAGSEGLESEGRRPERSEGSWTMHLPTGEKMTIYDAATRYHEEGVPLLVLAGKEYGTGSSRDWAAKGTALLGVRAVLAQSFERIHRSNLAGMGVLPLEFKQGDSAESLGIKGDEIFDFQGIDDNLNPRQDILAVARSADGTNREFPVTVRLDTPVEVDYFHNGGILQTVLRKLI